MHDIYLDYAATTPVHAAVIAEMQAHLSYDSAFGNAASQHGFGKAAKLAIDHAREQVAGTLHAHPSEIIWTSGATESNNLAIKGIADLYQHKGKHIITMRTEHKSVLDTCMHLEKMGFTITYLTPLKNGLLPLDALENAIRLDTILVSIMAVNNETGIIQDLAKIRAITQAHDVLLHTDAVQAIGKMKIDVRDMPVDLMSLTAHKVYGPKGVGALYVRKRPRIRVTPLIHGGGQEQGMRSGTLPTHQIVGMGKAYELANNHFDANLAYVQRLRDIFLQEIQSIPNAALTVDSNYTVPHIANIQFGHHVADAMLAALPQLAASTSSACQEKSGSESHVLRAMGLSRDAIKASIRFSFGHYLEEHDVKKAAEMLKGLYR